MIIAVGTTVRTSSRVAKYDNKLGTVIAVYKGDSLTASSYTVRIGHKEYLFYHRKLTVVGE